MTTEDIIADSKDWTWVLERPCPECGLNAGDVSASDVGGLIRDNAAQFDAVLSGDPVALAKRPNPSTWSKLEYGAHVRDVYRLFHQRLRLMLDSDDPLFDNWDQDDTAVAERYSEQRPGDVARDLTAAAEVLAQAFDAVSDEQWQRVGRRSDGASFTVESFARYLIHDPVHHLWDVSRT